MAPLRYNVDAIVAIIFVVAMVLEGFILYRLVDPIARLNLGLLVFVLAIWSIVWVLQHIGVTPPFKPRRRRYHVLRARVRDLLKEISRLNWMVVDAERGIRTRDDALTEIDSIEERLHNMIVQIRAAAGRTTPDLDDDEEATQY